MLNFVIQKALSFTKKEDGATAIEYGLIAALIAVVLIVAINLVGTSLTNVFTGISTELDAAISD
jgi:pilus assembly protein Flp/PilA